MGFSPVTMILCHVFYDFHCVIGCNHIMLGCNVLIGTTRDNYGVECGYFGIFVSLLLCLVVARKLPLIVLLLSCTSFLVDSLRRLCKSSCGTNMPPKIVLEQTNPHSIRVEAYFAHRWKGLSLTGLAC